MVSILFFFGLCVLRALLFKSQSLGTMKPCGTAFSRLLPYIAQAKLWAALLPMAFAHG